MTASVLWTITMLNFNRALENLGTMDDFYFTNFLSDRVMGCSTEGASFCYFRKAVSNNYFQKVFLITFISNYANSFEYLLILLIHFCSLDRKLEGYEKCALRKEPVIAPFVEWFKTATLRKSHR